MGYEQLSYYQFNVNPIQDRRGAKRFCNFYKRRN